MGYYIVLDKLFILEKDTSQFLKRVGDSGGGQYSVNMKEAFNQLAWATLENIVMERFGSKAARIFRYIRLSSLVAYFSTLYKTYFWLN